MDLAAHAFLLCAESPPHENIHSYNVSAQHFRWRPPRPPTHQLSIARATKDDLNRWFRRKTLNSKTYVACSNLWLATEEEPAWVPTMRAPGERVEKGVMPPPTTYQGCISAQWVPMEELEGGYDHSFGHRGVSWRSPTAVTAFLHACTTGAVTVGAKIESRRNHSLLLVEVPKVSLGTPLSFKKLVLSPS